MSWFANVLPRQKLPIPWGWENTTVDGGPWGSATYVSKNLGRIEMPPLLEYFDWRSYVVEDAPCTKHRLGTRNYKSIFTTAARFLGYEKVLATRPALTEITDGLLAWNKQLLFAWGGFLNWYMIGDDVAGNTGTFMSREHFRQWLLPEYERLVAPAHAANMRVVYHSDGDILDILPDLLALGVDTVSYEPIGRLADFSARYLGMNMRVVEDQNLKHENSMRLQR